MAKPLLFLTGFFGSGKTTLLRSLVVGLKKRNLTADVILNDFSNAELDAATLGEDAASIVPIAASCACCESLDELVSLCTAASESSSDVLFIELNGTADPLSLLEAFTLVESRLPFFPRIQVGMVDARHWVKRGDWNPLEIRQLETAGYWVLSHTDYVGQDRIDEVAGSVRSCARYAVRTSSKELLEALEGMVCGQYSKTIVPDVLESLHAVGRTEDDPVHLLSHRFSGVQFPLPPRVRRHSVEALLTTLPDWVVRAKALVKLVEHPGSRWLFQRSGKDPLPPPLPVPNITKVSPSLVCIGACLSPDAIKERIEEFFGEDVGRDGFYSTHSS